jgi:hypothetical protein
MGRCTAGFDPAVVTAADSARVVNDDAAVEAMASTLKALAAARAADGGGWRRAGHRSPAEALARQTGTSLGAAREVLDTGRRLDSQPQVAAAARLGQLSAAQTAMIANAAAADPSDERRLIAQARRSTLAELRDACVRTKAAAHPDLEERRRVIHAGRHLRSWTDLDGAWHLAGCGNPEDGAQIMAAIAPLTDELFRTARAEGRRESPAAYAFDAVVQLARQASSGHPPPVGGKRRGAPVKLLLRVNYDTWLRGVGIEGDTCELVSYGPIALSAVRDLLATGDPFVTAILTRGQALVGVAHLGRQPTAHQHSALEWLYPSCAAEGCPAQAHLQRDHRLDWAKTHYTMFDLLDLLCAHHHNLKTREGWQLVQGSGKRPFVPPGDPRHPRHQRPPPPPGGSETQQP